MLERAIYFMSAIFLSGCGIFLCYGIGIDFLCSCYKNTAIKFRRITPPTQRHGQRGRSAGS